MPKSSAIVWHLSDHPLAADQPTQSEMTAVPVETAPGADALQQSYGHHRYTQWVLMAVTLFAYLLFWWGGKLVNVPAHPGFEPSLLRQPGAGPVVAVLTAAVFFLGVTALVTLVARRHWIYSGVLAASAGLAAWSFRGGPIQYALIAPDPVHAGPGAFYVLALELALLGVIVAAAWLVVLPRVDGLSLPGNQPRPLIPKPPTEAYGAILGQSVFIGLAIALLVPNADKKQAVFGVLVACFIATLLAQHF